MAINVRCDNPACRRPLRVRDGSAGKRVKCPACAHILLIAPLDGTPHQSADLMPRPKVTQGRAHPIQRPGKSSRGAWLGAAIAGLLVGGGLVGGIAFCWVTNDLATSSAGRDFANAELGRVKAEAALLNANSESQAAELTKSRAETASLKTKLATAQMRLETTSVEPAKAKADGKANKTPIIVANTDPQSIENPVPSAGGDAHPIVTKRPKFTKPVDVFGEIRALEGDDVATCVTFSQGSRTILSNFGKRIVLWDVETGKERARLIGHRSAPSAIAFAPEKGEVLSVCPAEHSVRRWDVKSGLETQQFDVENANFAVFSADGRRLATQSSQFGATGEKGVVKLWDTTKGSRVLTLEDFKTPLAFLPDGKRLFLTRQAKKPAIEGKEFDPGTRSFIVDLATKKEDQIFPDHRPSFSWIYFSPASDRAMLASPARLWDLQTRKEVLALETKSPYGGPSQPVTDHVFSFSSDGKRVLSAGNSNFNVRLWDITGTQLREFKGHTATIACLAISPNGRYGVSGSYDHTLRLWSLETGEELACFEPYPEWVEMWIITKSRRYRLVYGGELPDAYLCDASTGAVIKKLVGHTSKILCVATSKDDKWLVTGSLDGSVHVWDMETGTEKTRFVGHRGYLRSVSISIDGRHVVSAGADKTVRIWETSTGKETRRFVGHDAVVTTVALAPDGKRVISGGLDHSIRIWDVPTGRELARFLGHGRPIRAVELSPDGKFLLSAGDDATVRLWEVETAREVRSYPYSQVRSLAFSPDGTQYLILPNGNPTPIVYETQGGKHVISNAPQPQWVTEVITTHTLSFETVPFSANFGGSDGFRTIRIIRRR